MVSDQPASRPSAHSSACSGLPAEAPEAVPEVKAAAMTSTKAMIENPIGADRLNVATPSGGYGDTACGSYQSTALIDCSQPAFGRFGFGHSLLALVQE